ncbi:MAG: glycosyl transferase family 1 [Mucilaginibacter sp.]|nr:glycosyl transferase family 1 [Mucilaginibacter sp.]
MDPVSGGPSQGIRNLDLVMKDMGVTREVVCLDAPESSYLANESLIIHALGPCYGRWSYTANLKPWLKANLSRFDVVILNGLWSYHSYATWQVFDSMKKSLTGKPPRLLVMPHGMLDPYFQRAKDRRLKAIRNWFYWKLIERKVINNADGLLFTCQTELLLAQETFRPYHPHKEYNVGYGIEKPPAYHQDMLSAFLKLCPGLNEAPYLLFLSRIHPKKGVDMLINAYIKLHEESTATDNSLPRLVIAGPGLDTHFGKKLQLQLTNNPKAKANVFFPGMLNGDSKWGAFYGCEAFVLPSHQENFGIAVAEALACAKPVLISDQVNIWREIIAEDAGIVANDNQEAVYDMIKQWLGLPGEKRLAMRSFALTAYKKHFKVSKVAKNFFKAFVND